MKWAFHPAVTAGRRLAAGRARPWLDRSDNYAAGGGPELRVGAYYRPTKQQLAGSSDSAGAAIGRRPPSVAPE